MRVIYCIKVFCWLACAMMFASCSRGDAPSDPPAPAVEDTGQSLPAATTEKTDETKDGEHSFFGLVYDPIEPAPDFLLTDTAGNEVTLSDFTDEILLLYFGFTHCPDACPLTLSTWRQAANALGEDAQKINFAFITVDPERDSPALLRKHLDIFSTDFMGLWAPLDDTEDIARSYNVFMEMVDTESAAKYFVNHTTLTFVIDQGGQRILAHQLNVAVDELVADLRYLLDNPPTSVTVPPADERSTTVEQDHEPETNALFHPSDPNTFVMAAGQPQFVEIFAFW